MNEYYKKLSLDDLLDELVDDARLGYPQKACAEVMRRFEVLRGAPQAEPEGVKHITVSYTGKSPNLCSGRLTVVVNGSAWIFPNGCLSSGGYTRCGTEDTVEHGPWTIGRWPDKFPENLKADVLDEINAHIPWGCCGGCL